MSMLSESFARTTELFIVVAVLLSGAAVQAQSKPAAGSQSFTLILSEKARGAHATMEIDATGTAVLYGLGPDAADARIVSRAVGIWIAAMRNLKPPVPGAVMRISLDEGFVHTSADEPSARLARASALLLAARAAPLANHERFGRVRSAALPH